MCVCMHVHVRLHICGLSSVVCDGDIYHCINISTDTSGEYTSLIIQIKQIYRLCCDNILLFAKHILHIWSLLFMQCVHAQLTFPYLYLMSVRFLSIINNKFEHDTGRMYIIYIHFIKKNIKLQFHQNIFKSDVTNILIEDIHTVYSIFTWLYYFPI